MIRILLTYITGIKWCMFNLCPGGYIENGNLICPHCKRIIARKKNDCEYQSIQEWQETVSSMGKLSDGLPYHSHRLRSLGNAVVPRQAKEAFKILMGWFRK